MFGTLRYDAESNNTLFQSGMHRQHSACDACRLRKLRCRGEENGCDRCKASSSICTYSETADNPQRRRKRAAASNNTKKSTNSTSQAQSISEPKTSSNSSRRAKSPEEPVRTSGRKDDQNMNQARSIAENDAASEVLPPVALTADEEGIMYDQVLQDLMPDLALPSMDYDRRLSALETQVDVQNSNGYLFNSNEIFMQRSFSPINIDQIDHSSQDLSFSYDTPTFSSHARTASSRVQEPSPVRTSTGQESPQANVSPQSHVGRSPPCKPRNMLSPKEQSGDQCDCLRHAVRLFEELENRTKTVESHGLDAALAHQKKAVKYCSNMVHCSACMSRPDYIMLLIIIINKLVDSCEGVVSELVNGSRIFSEGIDEATAKNYQKINFGQYEIDTPTEQNGVSRVLATLQLNNLLSLLAEMFNIAASASRESPSSTLHTIVQKVRETAEKLKLLESLR